MENKTIAMLAIALVIGTASASQAATVRDDTMACPSIDAWHHVMEKTKLEGFPAGIRVGNEEGCVSFPKGTKISVIDKNGAFSRVQAVRDTYYFLSQDLQ